MIREAAPDEEIKPAEFVYSYGFMSMEHNYLCAVCRMNPAVIECHIGTLQPCWICQKDHNYLLIKFDSKLKRLIKRWFL